MTDFMCPKSVTCCSDFLQHCLSLVQNVDAASYLKHPCHLVYSRKYGIRGTYFYGVHFYREVVIFPDGSSHLKMFDYKDQECYYRDSSGIQLVFVDNKQFSRVNYLDDCVMNHFEVEFIFDKLFNLRERYQ